MTFRLPELPYQISGLEPFISKKSLEVHHREHHLAYIKTLNNLIAGSKFENIDLETIIKVSDGPVYNNASQAWNHAFYFNCLNPPRGKQIKSSFQSVINHRFGSVTSFQNMFTDTAFSLFGVGWVWLVLNSKGTLEVIQESNAGNPLRRGLVPLLNCDLWEHAYYLDYQNRRLDYIEAFWKLINWELVEKRYNIAIQEYNII